MNIEGHWAGTIIYGKLYQEHAGKELQFDLQIIQNENNISGIAYDTGGTGTSPEPANIGGTLNGMKIEFIKQYARLHYFDNGKTKFHKSLPGPAISYSGTFDEKEQCFKGKWIYKEKVKWLWIIPITLDAGSGTWSMRRKGIQQ